MSLLCFLRWFQVHVFTDSGSERECCLLVLNSVTLHRSGYASQRPRGYVFTDSGSCFHWHLCVCVCVCGMCADKEYILMVIQAPQVKPPSDKKKEEKKD